MDEHAKAAGVDDFAAFRARMAQPRGAAAAVAAAANPEALLAAAASAAREAGGHELPPELLTRLASLGNSSGGAAATSSGAAAAKSPARRAPLVQELPSGSDHAAKPASPPAAAPSATASPAAQPAQSARASAPHSVALEAASASEPHGAVVLTAQLFDIASAAEVSLEASECEVVLLRAGADAAAAPLLRVALPERCLADAATARWDKRAKRLIVRMPRAAPM